MGELVKHARVKTIMPNVTYLEGFIEIGAAGAVASQSGVRDSGITWAKNASTGRYDATIHKAYRRVVSGFAAIAMPAVGTVPTLADGNQAFVQGITPAIANGTTGLAATGLSIQTTRTDTQAAANPTSGVLIFYKIGLSDSQRA